MGESEFQVIAEGETLVGPRFFPYMIAGFMGLLGLIMMAKSWRGASFTDRVELFPEPVRHVLVTIALGAVYILLLPVPGVLVTTAIYLAISFVYFGMREWGVVLLLSTGITLLIYLVFHRLMSVPLPN